MSTGVRWGTVGADGGAAGVRGDLELGAAGQRGQRLRLRGVEPADGLRAVKAGRRGDVLDPAGQEARGPGPLASHEAAERESHESQRGLEHQVSVRYLNTASRLSSSE